MCEVHVHAYKLVILIVIYIYIYTSHHPKGKVVMFIKLPVTMVAYNKDRSKTL